MSVPLYEFGSPTPSPASKLYPHAPRTKRGGALACGWGSVGGGVPIRTTGKKPSSLSTLWSILSRINSASLCILAGRSDSPIPTRFPAPYRLFKNSCTVMTPNQELRSLTIPLRCLLTSGADGEQKTTSTVGFFTFLFYVAQHAKTIF